jgi:GT2 family glycosyltransferase
VSDLANLTLAIATRDRPETLMRCLDSIHAGCRLPGEIVVVDQSRASTTRDVLSRYQAGPVRLVYIHQTQQGLSISRNTAAAQASRPVIIVTDDDCVAEVTWVANLERGFASAHAPAAITGRVLPLGPTAQGLYMIAPRTSTIRAEFYKRALPWLIGSGNNFSVRREWFLRVGGCDERLGVGSPGQAAEDMDFFYRLLKAGARIDYDPEVVVYHERQPLARRLATRRSYGFGMGALCGLWLRQRDAYGLYLLSRWLAGNSRALVGALARWDRPQVHQHTLSLFGSLAGLAYGLRVQATAGMATKSL